MHDCRGIPGTPGSLWGFDVWPGERPADLRCVFTVIGMGTDLFSLLLLLSLFHWVVVVFCT